MTTIEPDDPTKVIVVLFTAIWLIVVLLIIFHLYVI